MIDPVAEIARAQSAQLVDEDGREVRLVVEPGLQAPQIEALQARLAVGLPAELRALLAHTAGLDGVLEGVDFTGERGGGFEFPEIFPSSLSIAADGYGNVWVADLTPAPRDVAPVYFACHDPPVILVQSPSVGHFLGELFRRYVPPHASLVDDVHEDRLFDVWGANPGVLGQADALGGDDPVLAEFAAALDEQFELVDLRDAPVGMGFSWGRYGPRTEVRRHGVEPVFAYRHPPRRSGRLRRLLR